MTGKVFLILLALVLTFSVSLVACGGAGQQQEEEEEEEPHGQQEEEEPATPTSAPPRPDTPFVTEEEGQLFQDDFEDGNADGWALDPTWGISLESDSYVLTGREHSFALPDASGWSDYTIETRIKLLEGVLHFNLRHSRTADVDIRYFVAIDNGGFHLSKQIGSDFFQLTQSSVSLELNRWYTVKATLEGNSIRIYLDDSLVFSYTDEDIPILSGISSFETLENSVAYFDDISVTGTRAVQGSQWVKTGGPIGGLGYDVRIHPQDQDIMFVTDNPSGVQKSYDAGNTWVQRNDGLTARTGASGDGIPIFCLTIDPNNPDIVWAGTQGMRGIYKSTDCGEIWTKKDNGIDEWHEITFRGFAVKPDDSDIVLAAAEIDMGIQGEWFAKVKGKIYKTIDGGDNWYPVWEGDSLARVVIYNPVNPDIVYASTGIFDREAYNEVGEGILKSLDGGETWFPINNGLDRNLFIGFLDMHPEDPQTLIAAAGCEPLAYVQGYKGGVYLTHDGGNTWEKVLDDDLFTVAAFGPSCPDTIYAGNERAFYRSDDGAETWERYSKPSEGCYGPPGISPGIPIGIVISPADPMTLYVNNYDGGVFKSVDGAETWIDSSQGYTGANIWDIEIVQYEHDTVFASCRASHFRSYDGGMTWQGLAFTLETKGAYCIVGNPVNSEEMLTGAECWLTIMKSTDGGDAWRVAFHQEQPSDPRNPIGIKTIAYAQSDPNRVYAGTRRNIAAASTDLIGDAFGIYRSFDGGENWEEANGGLEASSKNINTIVVHPQNSDAVYAATPDQGILKTTNGGDRWDQVNNGLFSLAVESLAIDPENPDTVYAGLAEGVGIFKTTNGGELWEPINAGIQVLCPSFLQRVGQVLPGVSLELPDRFVRGEYYSIPWTNISSIVIDPVEPQILYAADLRMGVYMSTDGGASWTPINDGLSTKAVNCLALSADGWILYAATSGEGVFRLELW